LRARQDVERPQQNDAQRKHEQAPEGRQDDQGGVAAAQREERHLQPPWSASGPRSIPSRASARFVANAVFGFLSLVGGLVVTVALEPNRAILLFHVVAGGV